MFNKADNIDLNEVIISGHVKNNIFYAVTENNIPVVNFILTGNGVRGDKNIKRNVNHRVVAYNDIAEYIKNNVKENDYLLITGSLRYRKVPINGKNFYSCDVEANEITIAPTKLKFYSSKNTQENQTKNNNQEEKESDIVNNNINNTDNTDNIVNNNIENTSEVNNINSDNIINNDDLKMTVILENKNNN